MNARGSRSTSGDVTRHERGLARRPPSRRAIGLRGRDRGWKPLKKVDRRGAVMPPERIDWSVSLTLQAMLVTDSSGTNNVNPAGGIKPVRTHTVNMVRPVVTSRSELVTSRVNASRDAEIRPARRA